MSTPSSASTPASAMPRFSRHSRQSSEDGGSASTVDPPSPPPASSTRPALPQLPGVRHRSERERQGEEVQRKPRLLVKLKARPLNPEVDLRSLDHVTPVDTNLMCAICRCAFIDPVVLDCDHCFCRECLTRAWTEYRPGGPRAICPTCRAQSRMVGSGAVSKILLNMVDDLVVKCPKRDDGCAVELKRGEVQDHINLYCRYSWVKCPVQECARPVRRKDGHSCLHHGVTCFDCHESMNVCDLEFHWLKHCPDRKVTCDACSNDVFYRDLSAHTANDCPALNMPCPGASLACDFRSKQPELDMHTKSCTLAKLAPVFATQLKRQNEQEEAQKQLTRRLRILEDGFGSIKSLLDSSPSASSPSHPGRPSAASAVAAHNRTNSAAAMSTASPVDYNLPMLPSSRALQQPLPTLSTSTVAFPDPYSFFPPVRPASPDHIHNPEPPATNGLSGHPDDIMFPYPASSSSSSSTTPPPNPFASPVQHLLSLHESLRDEVSRLASALHDLDGRHSLLIMNETLRLKEENAYLAAQVAGLGRQVAWLSSARLQGLQQQQQSQQQRLGGSGSTGERSGGGGGAAAAAEGGGTGSGAVDGRESEGAAGSAARGTSMPRMVLLGRRPTDEGRTKL